MLPLSSREERERRVSSVELFFDLVFVFAFTQVTTFWLEHTSWGGLGRGVLVLIVLWWAWASYAWLTNAADAEAGAVTSVLLIATGVLFIAALSVPDAFSTHRLLFALSFFLVLVAFVGLYAVVSRDVPDQLAAVLRLGWTLIPAGALIVGAAYAPAGIRPALWAVAFVVGFFGPNAGGLRGWSVQPAHFAERHGLIVIIALGESLGAIGFGARNTQLDFPVVATALLGLLVAASLWLAYFDYVSGGIRHLLAERRGEKRVAFARDVYTYAHLGMVVGIVLFAFAMRVTLAHVHAELELIPAFALCVGCSLYLLSFVWLRWRVTRTLGLGRPIAAAAFLLLLPAVSRCPRRPLSRSSPPSGSGSMPTSSSGGGKNEHGVERRAETRPRSTSKGAPRLSGAIPAYPRGESAEPLRATDGAVCGPFPNGQRHSARLALPSS